MFFEGLSAVTVRQVARCKAIAGMHRTGTCFVGIIVVLRNGHAMNHQSYTHQLVFGWSRLK